MNQRIMRKWMTLAIATFGGILAAWRAMSDSPTLDEVGHLPAGTYIWEFGRFDVYRVNPPLVRMLAGVPVIATRTGGVPEVVEDGRTGRLVPPRDPVALAHGIAELLDRHELRHAYAHNAREKVEREFSAEQMVEGTVRFYAHVLEQWKSSP